MAYERCTTAHERRTRQRRRERRRRIEERVEHCRRREWWDPRGWLCWLETIVRTVVETVVEEVVEWVAVTRCVIEETPSVIAGLVAGAIAALIGLVALILEVIRALAELLLEILGHPLPGSYRICSDDTPPDANSVPRSFGSAFSMAGGQAHPGDYRDDGVRYEFRIQDREVHFLRGGPDGMQTGTLVTARSFHRRRQGEPIDVELDMIAASGGRVFAKRKGKADFYFTAMDEMFVHGVGAAGQFSVPSIHFQNDAEKYQPGARVADLVAPIQTPARGFGNHPAGERFPAMRALLSPDLPVTNFMPVRLVPRVWHRIDTRPSRDAPPVPAGIPQRARPEIAYCPVGLQRLLDGTTLRPESIGFDEVLGIGVGHVHLHESYMRIYGGELQPLLDANLANMLTDPLGAGANLLRLVDLRPFFHVYRFFNGPVRDGDGFVDGTCNFYALVRLAPDPPQQRYALLWTDEQMAFSRRWRLVHPRDCEPHDLFGLNFSLVASLKGSRQLYPDWHEENFWCPFQDGHITEGSRLAVSRQVLVVNGVDSHDGREELYSVNFSWGTIDRTWRWRRLPIEVATRPPLADGADPVCDPAQPEAAHLGSVELREDMILSVRGTHRVEGTVLAGRWYQRYLPADLHMVGSSEAGKKPTAGYTHPWQFVPEETWRRMSRFRFFGCYETRPDSRAQYYEIDPGNSDSRLGDEAEAWADIGDALFIQSTRLNWQAYQLDTGLLSWDFWFPVEFPLPRPASLYNRHVHLRILRRGRRWLAVHDDKRDDDLSAFTNLASLGFAAHVTLQAADSTRIDVTLGPNMLVLVPPAVCKATVSMRREASGGVVATIRLVVPRRVFNRQPSVAGLQQDLSIDDNIWRVKIGVLDRSGPRILLDVERDGTFSRGPAADPGHDELVFEWHPTGELAADVTRFCTPHGQMFDGTSIWFVDVLGHLSTADQTVFE